MNLLRILCISASNNFRPGVKETYSYQICKTVLDEADKHVTEIEGEIIELKNLTLSPCRDCMKCLDSRRCVTDDTFNQIYEKIIACDILFIVSPHYAPVPAKLCMLLEKMEEITFYRWEKDTSYQSEVYGIKTAVISHGGGSGNEFAQADGISQTDYKKVVNDPIANALDTIQLKLIPYDDEWNTGIVVKPETAEQGFDKKIGQYVRQVLSIEYGDYR
ncbi:MAG: NAD(P)H-dependent oxidoreductase [Oscillospiraceae bacterium]|jgi:multimeric flavodoxin WrbA|nr:NAD(P)H-dependent oxidoreductase [Oscillospiraceae bacterium]